VNSKPFRMPHRDAYNKVYEALHEYYWLCFPDFDEGDIYDLVRGPLVEMEDTVRRLYEEEGEK
jgi:hypothetical protein